MKNCYIKIISCFWFIIDTFYRLFYFCCNCKHDHEEEEEKNYMLIDFVYYDLDNLYLLCLI